MAGRDEDRLERIIEKLITLWWAYPDCRLIQLIYVTLGNPQGDLFHVEDTTLEKALDEALLK